MSCIFCQIVNKRASADIVYENDTFLAFKDIQPKARLHFLIVPKKHIPSVNHLEDKDKNLIGQLVLTAKKIAKNKKIAGYKLLLNVGRQGGQIVDHLHLHLLAGFNKRLNQVP